MSVSTWTDPRTWTTGDVITAGFANQFWRDNLKYLFGFAKNVLANVPHEFGGSRQASRTETVYPAGATIDKLVPETDVVAFDSIALPEGTYALQAVLAVDAGDQVFCSLMNLTDADTTPLVTLSGTSSVGLQLTSGAITLAASGVTKTYGLKMKTGGGKNGWVSNARIVRTT